MSMFRHSSNRFGSVMVRGSLEQVNAVADALRVANGGKAHQPVHTDEDTWKALMEGATNEKIKEYESLLTMLFEIMEPVLGVEQFHQGMVIEEWVRALVKKCRNNEYGHKKFHDELDTVLDEGLTFNGVVEKMSVLDKAKHLVRKCQEQKLRVNKEEYGVEIGSFPWAIAKFCQGYTVGPKGPSEIRLNPQIPQSYAHEVWIRNAITMEWEVKPGTRLGGVV